MELKKLKVKKIKQLESTRVHDISVSDVQHYITKNGVINHNSGREYGASIILMLTKAKLKDIKKEQIGIIITAKPKKNRFAKPTPVKTHLDYKIGLNEFTGLQDYMEFGWEKHGVEKGEIYTEKELKKKAPAIRGKAIEFKCKEDKEHGVESTMYFYPKSKCSTIAVKSLGRHLKSKEFFSPLFFTNEKLKEVDEYAKPFFNYGMNDELPDDELFDTDDTDDIDNEIDPN